jgi:hypothetical protein
VWFYVDVEFENTGARDAAKSPRVGVIAVGSRPLGPVFGNGAPTPAVAASQRGRVTVPVYFPVVEPSAATVPHMFDVRINPNFARGSARTLSVTVWPTCLAPVNG